MVVGVPRSGSQSKPLRQRYRSLSVSVVTGERRAGNETPLEARRLPSLADSFREMATTRQATRDFPEPDSGALVQRCDSQASTRGSAGASCRRMAG